MTEHKYLTTERIAEIKSRIDAFPDNLDSQTRFVYRLVHCIREHGLKHGLLMGGDVKDDWPCADIWANSSRDIRDLLSDLDALRAELEAAQKENQKNLELWAADVADKDEEIARLREENARANFETRKWLQIAETQHEAHSKALDELNRLRKALEELATDDWGHLGGRLIYGNESMFGETGEFYKGYNAGVRGQFSKTQGIARRALNTQGPK